MARYRNVEVRTWSDLKFRELTPVPPCGQGLWLWFLTGTRTTNIPGVVLGTDAVMAAELRWPLEAFHEAFAEVLDKGMVKHDWKAGLVWLPNASRPGDSRNKPVSPNVVKSWRDTWAEIPECGLKLEIWQQLKAFTEVFGEGFVKAFLEVCRKPSVKARPIQEQEQEQKQEKDSLPTLSQTEADQKPSPKPSDHPQEPSDNPQGADTPSRARDDGVGLLAELQAEYPAGIYRQGNWILGEREAMARLEEGEARDRLRAGCRRYRLQCEARKIIGTQYVMSPENFFARGKHGEPPPYLDPFPLPAERLTATEELLANLDRTAADHNDDHRVFEHESDAEPARRIAGE